MQIFCCGGHKIRLHPFVIPAAHQISRSVNPPLNPEQTLLFRVPCIAQSQCIESKNPNCQTGSILNKNMKSKIRIISFCTLLGAPTFAQAAPTLIPNGDFSSPGGASFGFFQSAAGVVTFPTTGGSGDNGGYVLINNTLGSWGGGIVSPPDNFYSNNQGIPLSNLGLVAGKTYTFSMDMKNFAGSGTGGLKLEAWNNGGGAASNTGDVPASGSSNQWATYSWNYTIPAGTLSIKIVPLLTGASGGSTADSVGIDNIKVNNTPVPAPPFIPDTITNGDFEVAGGSGWATETTGPQISFPATGGNTGGHAVIDASVTEGFAAIKAFGGAEKTFASLGLAPGDVFRIEMDMKILAGQNIGGVRLVGPAGFDFLSRPAIIGDGSTWETYSIPITVPAAPSQALFSFVWGFNSQVAFDNIKIVLPAPAAPLQATIAKGTSVSWTAPSAVNSHQPQESADNTQWTNLGSAIVGNSVVSIFDASPSPFYRVLESAPTTTETVYNGNFAEATDIEVEAEGWNPVGNQLPTRLETGGRVDNGACMQIKALNSGANATVSEIQQNTKGVVGNTNGTVVPGNRYSLSLWAKQVSIGPSYVQEYRVSFLAAGGAELPPGGGQWQSFSANISGDWEKKTISGLVAPAGAVTALIQIAGKTGAVDGGLGEVLIDDVTLESSGFGTPMVRTAATLPAVEISWPSKTGQDYQVEAATDLVNWSNFGGVISGNNNTKAVYDTIAPPAKFYRVGELP